MLRLLLSLVITAVGLLPTVFSIKFESHENTVGTFTLENNVQLTQTCKVSGHLIIEGDNQVPTNYKVIEKDNTDTYRLFTLQNNIARSYSGAPAVQGQQPTNTDAANGPKSLTLKYVLLRGGQTTSFADDDCEQDYYLYLANKDNAKHSACVGGLIMVSAGGPGLSADLTLDYVTLIVGTAREGGAIWVGVDPYGTYGTGRQGDASMKDAMKNGWDGGTWIVGDPVPQISIKHSKIHSTGTDSADTKVQRGGCIFIAGDAKLDIVETEFEKCHAIEEGGAIYTTASEKTSIQNSTFTSCESGNGGVIFATPWEKKPEYPNLGDLTILDSTFTSNKATGELHLFPMNFLMLNISDFLMLFFLEERRMKFCVRAFCFFESLCRLQSPQSLFFFPCASLFAHISTPPFSLSLCMFVLFFCCNRRWTCWKRRFSHLHGSETS